MTHAPTHTPRPAQIASAAPQPAPVAVRVTITAVEAPPAFQFAATGIPDSKTGVRNDLKDAENAAAKVKAALAETPILTLTAPEGVPGVVAASTHVPYDLAPLGAPALEGGLLTLTLDSRLQVTAKRLPSGTIHAKVAFTHSHTVGPPSPELTPPETETVSAGLEDDFQNGDTRYIAKIPADSPTGRFYFATVTVLPSPKG